MNIEENQNVLANVTIKLIECGKHTYSLLSGFKPGFIFCVVRMVK